MNYKLVVIIFLCLMLACKEQGKHVINEQPNSRIEKITETPIDVIKTDSTVSFKTKNFQITLKDKVNDYYNTLLIDETPVQPSIDGVFDLIGIEDFSKSQLFLKVNLVSRFQSTSNGNKQIIEESFYCSFIDLSNKIISSEFNGEICGGQWAEQDLWTVTEDSTYTMNDIF